MFKSIKLKYLLTFGCMAAVLVTLTTADAAHAAKSRKRVRYSSNGLVPPPPAYMPAILPELYTVDGKAKEPPKPKNPYKKYVYTAEGHQEPIPVQRRKGVSYWQPLDTDSSKKQN